LPALNPDIEVPQVELIDTIDSIDFGFVDIDHGDDRYEQD
jgi:hypothetical protein